MRDFLKLGDRGSPLYGRAGLEISLRKFSRTQSLDFLRSGFKEAGLVVDGGELAEAVEKLDGIVGWLTLYGYYRVLYGFSHREALERVESDAAELVAGELEKLVKQSPKDTSPYWRCRWDSINGVQ